MIRSLYFVLFLLLPYLIFSQGINDKIIYLDSSYFKVDEGKHVYYQIIKDFHLTKDAYVIEEFYKSGKIKKTANSTDNLGYTYFGTVTGFFENDSIESKTMYKDGSPNGAYSSYYPNGKKQVEGEYVLDKFSKHKEQVLKITSFWDENGIQKVTDGNGIYDQRYTNFHSTGSVKNGLKSGVWTGTDKKMKIEFAETFENGQFISGMSTDKYGVDRKYTEVNERPSPKKGISHFYKFVGSKFKINRKISATGKIILSFIVDKNGSIDDIKIVKGIHPKLDEEAVRVLNLYADWQPGKVRGMDVNVLYSLPISIQND